MFYLDHNSTTPPARSVREAVAPYLEPLDGDTVVGRTDSFHGGDPLPLFGNPSSQTPLGARARAVVEETREEVSAFIGARPEELVFTSGGTESCFLAIAGGVLSYSHKRHLIISAVEHPALLEAARCLERTFGMRTTVLPVDDAGRLEPNRLFDALEMDTAVVSFMLANNETGVLFPVRELAAIARARGVVVHTDATQAVGRLPVDFQELGVDLLTFSGHKLGALKGIGGLVIREGARWEPLMPGGGQERGRRGGTEPVPLIAALGAAVRERSRELAGGAFSRLGRLRDSFESCITRRIESSTVNGGEADRIPNTSSISFDGISAQDLISRLAERGVYVSSGAACKSSALEPSHVLRAMGRSVTRCLGTIRFSFGTEILPADAGERYDEHLAPLVSIIAEEVDRLRAQSKGRLAQLLRT